MQNLFNESSVVHEAYQKIHLVGSKYVEYALEIYLNFIQKKKNFQSDNLKNTS